MTRSGLVQVEHRRQLLALEADQPVGVVLEQVEAALGGELHQAPALLLGERAAGRVVEVGDHVGERRVGARGRLGDGLDARPRRPPAGRAIRLGLPAG